MGGIHKITYYIPNQGILCAYFIDLTKFVLDMRVIGNFVYRPPFRGPPRCKVHQPEDTKFQVGQSHDLPYGVLGSILYLFPVQSCSFPLFQSHYISLLYSCTFSCFTSVPFPIPILFNSTVSILFHGSKGSKLKKILFSILTLFA